MMLKNVLSVLFILLIAYISYLFGVVNTSNNYKQMILTNELSCEQQKEAIEYEVEACLTKLDIVKYLTMIYKIDKEGRKR